MKTKFLFIVILAITFTSCSSGWSCKKRYVNNQKEIVIKNNYKVNS